MSSHHIGFSGTRHGMTERQHNAVMGAVGGFSPSTAHHGDCKGADADFHRICRKLGGIWMIGHPPTNDRLRAFCVFDEIREPADYLVRDRHIVEESNLLIAAPYTYWPQHRSGTWATIRYALARGKQVNAFDPEGARIDLNAVLGRSPASSQVLPTGNTE